MTATTEQTRKTRSSEPVLRATGLVKTFGRVVGLDGVDLEVYAGEILAIIGDNGAGKSTLVKCLTGADVADDGEIWLDGRMVVFKRPQDARALGIETVYQTLAVAPALDIASNVYLGRELRRPGPLGSVLRMMDKKRMAKQAGQSVQDLGIRTIQDMGEPVESLSGGQRQAVAVARAAAFGSKVVFLDEPTAALGVKESNAVLDMIRKLRDSGLAIVLVSHNMPHVFDLADRIHIQRLGGCAGVITPQSHTMSEAVAIMTGATTLDETPGNPDGAAASRKPAGNSADGATAETPVESDGAAVRQTPGESSDGATVRETPVESSDGATPRETPGSAR